MSKVSLNISALIVLLACSFAMPVRAIVFDWDAAYGTWGGAGDDPGPGSSATRNFNNDPSNAGIGGNDVSITIANTNSGGSGFNWRTDGDYDGMIVDNSPLNPAGQRALQYQVLNNNGSGIRTTVTFNYASGVKNVSFTLWDVDRLGGQFTDVISAISAQTVLGTTIGPSSVTTSANNSQSGSGTGIVVTGLNDSDNNTTNGNVTITFNSLTPITSFTFLWRNTDGGLGQQFIAMHDITYTPVPEVGTGLAALGACVGATLIRRRRQPAA